MIRIGIVDDEENARRVILKYLERYCENYQVVFEATDYQDTVDATLKHQPDLLFLDIHLLEGTGIEVAQELMGKSDAKIIFTTAYNEYAINALRLKAFDYLLKPIDIEEFQDSLQRVIEEIESEKSKDALSSKITISTLSGTQILEKNEILFMRADASYCTLLLVSGKSITISKPMKYIEKLVEKDSTFLKIHKSYITNVDCVKLLDRVTNELVLCNDERLPISRSNLKIVFNFFQGK